MKKRERLLSQPGRATYITANPKPDQETTA